MSEIELPLCDELLQQRGVFHAGTLICLHGKSDQRSGERVAVI